MNDKDRWLKAAHAMQSGVQTAIELGLASDCTPKHLRVGVNVALRDQGSLVSLLIAKGVFTEAEYIGAIADGMEEEKARHELELSEKLGRPITLE
jgi:hypothetical protein